MEKKIQCSQCRLFFDKTDELFAHLKNFHKMCGNGNFACTLCGNTFSRFGSYQKHVVGCFNNMDFSDEETLTARNEVLDAYNAVALKNDDVIEFSKLVEEETFKIASKLNAIMMLPRSLVTQTIKEFDNFLRNVIVKGMNKVVIPRIDESEKRTVTDFVDAVQASFSNVMTEKQFVRGLIDRELIEPFEKCTMIKDDENDEDTMDDEGTTVLMPIKFQIKKFLELPGVFQKITDHYKTIRQKGKLNHYINGELWTNTLKNFDDDQIVLPYFYYVDGAQLNHPLGPHCRSGEEDLHYYSFPAIPTQYQSRLENIFVAYLLPETYINEFGLEKVYGNVIEELTELAKTGIAINVDETERRVFFVLAAFLADNKEANVSFSFNRSHNSDKFCRYCRMDSEQTKIALVEDPHFRRTKENYHDDVLAHDPSATGVREYSTLNEVPYFHVIENSAQDLTHTVEEGIVKYNVSEALHYLIYVDKLFTLKTLNERMQEFQYGHEEKANKPKLITKDHLDNRKLKMSAAEVGNFVQNITFIIGDLVPFDEDNKAWTLILKTVQFFDYCYLPCYEDEDLTRWRDIISEMHHSYVYDFDEHLKPKHHYTTHFLTDTKKLGPLRYTRTIRYEGKHRELKSYTKNSNNRIDLSYSIAKKVQYNFADRLLNLRGLDDIIDATLVPGRIKEKVYFHKLQNSMDKKALSEQRCLFTDSLKINGMQFKRGMWLPDVLDDGNRNICKISEICDFILLSSTVINQMYAVCKSYRSIPIAHYAGYEVDMTSLHSEFVLVNIGNFLENHHYPITTYAVGGNVMFRCKRF